MGHLSENLIWHYTNAAGLEGILRTRSFFASHFASLNDSSELRYADEVFRAEALAWARQQGHPDGVMENGLHGLAWYGSRRATMFVVSFSRAENDLSQWRSYGRSGGFALGFDDRVELDAERFRPVRADVCYSADDQSALVAESLVGVGKVISDYQTVTPKMGFVESLRYAVLEGAPQALPFLKNPAFLVEKETRIAFLPPTSSMQEGYLPSGVRVRIREDRLQRYVEARWSDSAPFGSPLRAVMIGPGQAPSVVDDVQALLMQHGLYNVAVSQSDIPVRN